MTKKMWFTSLILSFVLVLSACGGGGSGSSPSGSAPASSPASEGGASGETSSGEPVELRMMWWGSQARHDATLKVLELFHQKYPNITIKGEYMGSDSYWDKLNTLIAGGSAPDLLQFGNNYPDYAARGSLLDLTPYMGKEIDVSHFDPSVVEAGAMDGKQYGISLGSNALALIYNKALVEKAGMEPPKESMTWEEFEAYGTQLKEKLGDDYYAFTDLSSSAPFFAYYARQSGKPMYDVAAGKTGIGVQDAADWLSIWDRYRAAGLIPTAEEAASAYTETGPDTSAIVQSKAVLSVVWSNQINAYQSLMQDELGAVLPPSGGTTQGMWIQPSQFLTGYAKTEHPKEVAMFISFMVNDPEATAILGSERGIPGSSKVRDALKDSGTATNKMVYEYLDLAIANSRTMDRELPNSVEFNTAMTQAAETVSFKQGSVEQAAQIIVDGAQAAIDKSLK
ncbi:ABC transporter substrate-binding protein [Cohnella massiliensis]|uniref:ABC transporter substrate-binding protein n=1 Tax=Cohnella massiliensis TaxID=1816691 RepID=UPI0009BA8C72|nr:extracellular solute-binding protein [Cohnella massiliensis]